MHCGSLEVVSSFEFQVSDFSSRHVANSPDQNLTAVSDGDGDDPCLARSLAGDLARRICGDYGAVGLGKIHDDEFDRMFGYADLRGI